MTDTSDKNNITIGELYPDCAEEERAEIEENMAGYVHLVRRIFERVRREPARLTESVKRDRF